MYFYFDISGSGGKAPGGKNEQCRIIIEFLEPETKSVAKREFNKDVQFFDITECIDVLQESNVEQEIFLVCCLASVASRSVFGKKQYRSLCRNINYQLKSTIVYNKL